MSDPRAVGRTGLPLGEPGIERLPEGILVVRDVLDGQLLTRDGIRIARVADVEFAVGDDGGLCARDLVLGPEALARRVSRIVGGTVGRLLRGRFDHRIPFSELLEVGPWLRLRGAADEYPRGSGDRWLADHLLRLIPGSGHASARPRRPRWSARRG